MDSSTFRIKDLTIRKPLVIRSSMPDAGGKSNESPTSILKVEESIHIDT